MGTHHLQINNYFSLIKVARFAQSYLVSGLLFAVLNDVMKGVFAAGLAIVIEPTELPL